MGEAYLDWQKKSGGIKLNDVIEEYRYVAAGKQIKAGDLVNYINGIAGKTDYGESVDTQLSTETNSGYAISAAKLDENRVFVAHSYGTSYYLYGVVVTIDGASITYGTDTELCNVELSGAKISIAVLDENRVFVAHSYSSYYLYGMVVTINNTTIVKGNDTVLGSVQNAGYVISVELLKNGNIFIAHSYGQSVHLYGIVCTISGTTITTGTDTSIVTGTSNTGQRISTCLLPNGNVFIAHSYGSNYYLYGIVVSISGTTITAGSDTALVSSQYAGSYISTCLLLNGNVFIAHSYGSGYYLQGRLISISGTTISELDNLILRNSAYTAYAISTHLLPNGDVFIAHSGDFVPNETTYYLYGIIVSVSNNRIVAGTDIELINTRNAGSRISSLLLDNGTIFIAHSNSSSYYLNAQMWGIDEENNIPTNHIVATEYEQQVTPAIEPPFNAVALSSGVGGTDTEHNEQVKIARLLQTIQGNILPTSWTKVSKMQYVASNGDKIIFGSDNSSALLVPDLYATNNPLGNVCDGNPETYFQFSRYGTGDSTANCWIEFDLHTPVAITKYKSRGFPTVGGSIVKSCYFQGSNDGETWETLPLIAEKSLENYMIEVTINNTKAWSKYRFYMNIALPTKGSSGGVGANEFQVSECLEVIQ